VSVSVELSPERWAIGIVRSTKRSGPTHGFEWGENSGVFDCLRGYDLGVFIIIVVAADANRIYGAFII
jgi:hypothetical protein